MSSAYDQQLRKLIDHIQTLNRALHERDAHLVQWQQISRAVQDERGQLAQSLFDVLKQTLNQFAGKFQGLKAENAKLRGYIDHQKQLHEILARDMQGQLQYALNRIDDLSAERLAWRQELNTHRLTAIKSQQQLQEQRGVVDSQQAALTELKRQLEAAMVLAQREETHQAEMKHLRQELASVKTRLATQDQHLAARDHELQQLAEAREQETQRLMSLREQDQQRALAAYETLKQRASQELYSLQAELAQARQMNQGVDERVAEMTALLANSEREVARLFKELGEERALRKEAEIRLATTGKDLRKAKTAVTKLEKAEKAAKGEQMTDLQKRLDEMTRDYKQLQDELASAVRDKTAYMQALEGNKGKVRPLPPPADGGTT
ncbi:MAG: hypothetical protein VKP62_14055 [Candidatus Sericytochromatia bacterium]|nr:hypothetical protein [Candidatus Sericytochromatia bacterium]